MARAPARTLGVLLCACAAAGCGWTNDADTTDDGRQAPGATTPTLEEGDVQAGDVDETMLELEEVGDSGISGTARVTPGEGDALSITVELDEGHEQTHGIEARVGSCADATQQDDDAAAAEQLLAQASSYTLADIEDGQMQDEATLPDEIVSGGTYSLVVYAGPEVEGDVAACADVEVE